MSIFCNQGNKKQESVAGDTSANIRRHGNIFNQYINPGDEVIVTDEIMHFHGFHPDHLSIRDT